MVRLEAVLDSWISIRRDTAQAWLDMPAGEAEFRPTPELMKYRDLAVHNLNASHAIVMMLLAGETDFSTPAFRESMRSHFIDVSALDPTQLALQLETTMFADAAQALKTGDEAFWAGMITRFDGTPVTRLEMLQYAKEHELTHRSQMFMYLRLKGVVPPTTRRRMAAAAAAK
jgi:uncharacterized damage-inducible protein DinB